MEYLTGRSNTLSHVEFLWKENKCGFSFFNRFIIIFIKDMINMADRVVKDMINRVVKDIIHRVIRDLTNRVV